MFTFDYNRKSLLNTQHIYRIYITDSNFEQRQYQLVADMEYGTAIMFKGTKKECEAKLEEFAFLINAQSPRARI